MHFFHKIISFTLHRHIWFKAWSLGILHLFRIVINELQWWVFTWFDRILSLVKSTMIIIEFWIPWNFPTGLLTTETISYRKNFMILFTRSTSSVHWVVFLFILFVMSAKYRYFQFSIVSGQFNKVNSNNSILMLWVQAGIGETR